MPAGVYKRTKKVQRQAPLQAAIIRYLENNGTSARWQIFEGLQQAGVFVTANTLSPKLNLMLKRGMIEHGEPVPKRNKPQQIAFTYRLAAQGRDARERLNRALPSAPPEVPKAELLRCRTPSIFHFAQGITI